MLFYYCDFAEVSLTQIGSCSTLPIVAHQASMSQGATPKALIGGVSQVINMVYHSPAQL